MATAGGGRPTCRLTRKRLGAWSGASRFRFDFPRTQDKDIEMTDVKAALAAAAQTLQDVASGFDAALAEGINTALAGAHAQADALRAQVAALQDELFWASVDKTGATDETAALQQALDDGREIPAGYYLVDAVKGLTSSRDVAMDPSAVLITKPNGAPRYCLLHVQGDDLAVAVGQLEGDRGAHDYSAPGTHEWGYGLQLSGDRIKVTMAQIAEFTGDGVVASGTGIEVRNLISTRNRRNGMSLFNVTGFRAYDSEFSYTGAMGVQPGAAKGPWAGVDCEPDKGAASDIIFQRCKFLHNQSSDFLAWTRAGTGASVTGVQLLDCVLDGGPNGVDAKGLGGPVQITALRNTLSNHKGASFKVESGATVVIGSADAADANAMIAAIPRAGLTASGISTRYDIQVSTGGIAKVGVNKYA